MFPLINYNTIRGRSEVLADETVDLPLDHLLQHANQSILL